MHTPYPLHFSSKDQGKGNGPIPSNPPVNDPRPTIERVDSSVLSLYETAYRMVGATDNNSIEGGAGGGKGNGSHKDKGGGLRAYPHKSKQ